MEAPRGPWVWRGFSGPWGLYTAHSGSQCVLMPASRSGMEVRGEDGTLEPIEPDHPVATLIAAAPEMRDALKGAALKLEAIRRIIEEGGNPKRVLAYTSTDHIVRALDRSHGAPLDT